MSNVGDDSDEMHSSLCYSDSGVCVCGGGGGGVRTYPCSDWIDSKVHVRTALQVLARWVTGPEVGRDVLHPQL